MDKKLANVLLLGMLAVVLSGCASGVKYSDMKSTIPALKSEMGRIYFYRTSTLGAAIQPNVFLNNVNVGKATCQAFWYVDREPGDYQVTIQTEVERKLSFTLSAGQTRYVRLNVSMGFFMGHIYGELVEEAKALKELEECKYVASQFITAP